MPPKRKKLPPKHVSPDNSPTTIILVHESQGGTVTREERPIAKGVRENGTVLPTNTCSLPTPTSGLSRRSRTFHPEATTDMVSHRNPYACSLCHSSSEADFWVLCDQCPDSVNTWAHGSCAGFGSPSESRSSPWLCQKHTPAAPFCNNVSPPAPHPSSTKDFPSLAAYHTPVSSKHHHLTPVSHTANSHQVSPSPPSQPLIYPCTVSPPESLSFTPLPPFSSPTLGAPTTLSPSSPLLPSVTHPPSSARILETPPLPPLSLPSFSPQVSEDQVHPLLNPSPISLEALLPAQDRRPSARSALPTVPVQEAPAQLTPNINPPPPPPEQQHLPLLDHAYSRHLPTHSDPPEPPDLPSFEEAHKSLVPTDIYIPTAALHDVVRTFTDLVNAANTCLEGNGNSDTPFLLLHICFRCIMPARPNLSANESSRSTAIRS